MWLLVTNSPRMTRNVPSSHRAKCIADRDAMVKKFYFFILYLAK